MNLKAALYTVTTTPINGSSSYGQVTLWVPEQVGTADTICWAGHASGLGVDVRSTYGGGGDDCTAANGCGVHVHAGFSCADSTSQGGHWRDEGVTYGDPWKIPGYLYTDVNGEADFAGCAQIGEDVRNTNDLEGRAFVIHAEGGGRISCGIIEKQSKSSKSGGKGKGDRKKLRRKR